MYRDIDIVESESHENIYEVKCNRRVSVLNIIIIQVAICLVISLAYLAIHLFGGDELVQAVNNIVKIYV